MNIVTGISAVVLCAMSMTSSAANENMDIFTQNAQESLQSRFSVAANQTKTYGTFPANPWCGYKGQKNPANGNIIALSASYPNFNKGKVEMTTYPTPAELQWLNGLKNATDQKTYVDTNQSVIGYDYMSKSLNDGGLHCFWRSRSNGTTNIIAIENNYAEALVIASDDCKNHHLFDANFEQSATQEGAKLQSEAAQLQKDADKLQKDYDSCNGIFTDCNVFQAKSYDDQKKSLQKRQNDLVANQQKLESSVTQAQYMFKSCMNFAQLFTNPPALYNKPKQ